MLLLLTMRSFVFLYMILDQSRTMKSRQLLSVVFSLIMFTGVTASSTAFAETDEYYNEIEDKLEDFCQMSDVERSDFFVDYPDFAEFDEKLGIICDIENEDEREEALDEFIDAVIPETDDDDVIDSFEDCVEAGYPVTDSIPEECTFDDMVFVNDEDDDNDDVIDSFEDCVEAGYPVMESYPEQCKTDDDTIFVNDDNDDYSDDDRYADGDKFFVCHNGKALSIAESAMRAHLGHGDSMGRCGNDKHGRRKMTTTIRMHDKYSNKGPGNLRDHFAMYCDMTPEEKEEKMQMHDDLPEDLRADMMRYCEMTEDEQDSFRDSMMDKMDKLQ